MASRLSAPLLSQGHSVEVLDNLSTGSIGNIEHLKGHASFRYVIDSITNEPLLAECIDRSDVVFHLAASVGVRKIVEEPVHTIENNMARVEAFVFGTRLTRITRLIRRRSIDEAMERVSHEVQDWSGGTRIGQSLQTFNMVWARRVLRNGAVVLIISDGWDRGSPEVLRREMERLQRSSYRLLWLNPLLGSPRYEPLTRGMQAALPYIDDFLPIHNLASLEALARRLSTIDDYRPVRRQHPPLPHPSVPATT
mgnify:FL=1